MSWGIDINGTKEGSAKFAAAELDRIAAGYAGKEEEKDILAVKERVLSLIAAMDLTKDSYIDWNAVTVKASGSHSVNPNGLVNASFTVQVTRTSIKL